MTTTAPFTAKRMKIKQEVDPLVSRAIKDAVNKESLQEWALKDNPIIPKFTEVPVKVGKAFPLQLVKYFIP